jgi:hypothetical protein
MLKELKVKSLRRKSSPAYDIPSPVGSPINTLSSWNYQTPSVGNYAVAYATDTGGNKLPEDKRIEKKPVDVVNNIMAEKPSMDLNHLDIQIKIVKRRLEIMKEIGGNTRDEEIALTFLKARQKYNKVGKLFGWAVTNQEKIEQLCKEYKVMCTEFARYSRNVPQEGLDQLEKFFEAWNQVSDKKPAIRLIVDQGGKEQKKDPILLAQSPFGNWWYILGAWDKEVEIVDDLVYHCK